MNKHFYLLLAFLAFTIGAKAGPGDTTWVQANYDTHLSWYGDYDTTVTFPSGSTSYRKIYMIFTLGKYSCPGYDPNNPGDQPGQTGWCGDWDYTVQNYLMTPGGDTLELGRFITPYARQNAPRTPLSWKQRYIYDVTDYYPLLKNGNTFRIHYSGYSGGFTADVKFAFIEGARDRDVLGIEKLYGGAWSYGNSADPIDNHLPTLSKTAPAGTQSTDLRMTISGHGFDNAGCCEFASKYYQVYANGNLIGQKDIWRDNCGANDLYPQSGTWIYERGNWCPGAIVYPNIHTLTGVTAGNYNVNVDMEPYSDNGNGSYIIETTVFYYGGLNKNLNASLDDIISPTNFEGHYRQNPYCGAPKVSVANTGKNPITSLKFEYGVDGTSLSQYTWNGNLPSMAHQEIDLPEPWELRAASGDPATKTFTTKILEVNGTADDDATDNQIKNPFVGAPKWPMKLVIKLKTNNAVNGSGQSETSWRVTEAGGAIIKERMNNAPATLYYDTLDLGPGCYKLEVSDEGCDGLYWPWNDPSVGTGSFAVNKYGVLVPMTVTPYFSGNFGCGFTQYFTADWPTGVETVNNSASGLMELMPNPANDRVALTIEGLNEVKGSVRIIDAMGRTVYSQSCTSAQLSIDVSGLSGGVYSVVYDGKDHAVRLQSRLVIAR